MAGMRDAATDAPNGEATDLTADPLAIRVRLSGSAPDAPATMRVARAPASGVLAQRQLLVDDAPRNVALQPAGHERYVLEEDGARTQVVLGRAETSGGVTRREVLVGGFRFEIEVEPERIAALRERATRGRSASVQAGRLEVRAIIPGKVASVSVAAGDAVTAGQQLLVIEAMKMQNELRAPRDGTIDSVGVAAGVNIEVGDLLVVIS